MSREEIVSQTLVDLADTLVDEFDVVDLLTLLSDRCVKIFDVAAAGVMLVSPGSRLISRGDRGHAREPGLLLDERLETPEGVGERALVLIEEDDLHRAGQGVEPVNRSYSSCARPGGDREDVDRP